MTAKEMKIKTFSLIEEYFPELNKLAEDEDVLYKINSVINAIQMDLMQLRKINGYKELYVNKTDDRDINLKNLIPNLYQIKNITLEDSLGYNMSDEVTLTIPDNYEGKIKIYYYQLPKLMVLTFDSEEESINYDKTFTFDLDDLLLEIMPYGIASDLLKMDMISNYGKYFQEEYMMRKNQIDPRYTGGQVIFEGGVDV